jgi:short-subunit dehydrogenase
MITILITGATAGIGRHAALHLARAGHKVIATGRREAQLASLREESGGVIEIVPLDVTRAESIEALKTKVDEITGGHGVDVLVNNAGYGSVGPLETMKDADFRAQFETNVFGLMAMTRAFLPAMRERGSGRIINVSSMGGRVTFPFMGAYNATKYAVESLSDALRNEVAAFGVQVALIEPGAIHTEFTDRAMSTVAAVPEAGPYAAVLARADEIRKQVESTAVGTEPVVRAIAHAATARRARVRYVVPFRTRVFLALFAVLPSRLTDWMLRSMFKLDQRLAVA